MQQRIKQGRKSVGKPQLVEIDQMNLKRFDLDDDQQAVCSLSLAETYFNRISMDGKQLVSQTFKWYHGGSEVWLYGDFNHWEGQQMTKIDKKYTSKVIFKLVVEGLESGKYQFCFKVDGEWKNRPDLKCTDSINPMTQIKNHIVFISSQQEPIQHGYHSTQPSGLVVDESPIMHKQYITMQGNEVINEEGSSNDGSDSPAFSNKTIEEQFIKLDASRQSRIASDLIEGDQENIESGPELEDMEENKTPSEDGSEMDVKDAAMNLFNLILKPAYDQSPFGFISQAEYEQAVRTLIYGEPEQIQHLIDLFPLAVKDNGKLYPENILQVIEQDMRDQMKQGEQEEENGGTPEVLEVHSDGGTSNREKVNQLVQQLVDKKEASTSSRKPLQLNLNKINTSDFGPEDAEQPLDDATPLKKEIPADLRKSNSKSNHRGRNAHYQIRSGWFNSLRSFQGSKVATPERGPGRKETEQEQAQTQDQQARDIFEEIFQPFFAVNTELTQSEFPVLTFQDFRRAIDKSEGPSASNELLVEMFTKADRGGQGYLYEQELIDCIKEDILNTNDEAPKPEKQQLTETITSVNITTDPTEDPVLQMLAKETESKGQQSVINLSQAIEYVLQYKIPQYVQSEDSLRYLFQILHQTSLNACQQVESMQRQNTMEADQFFANEEMEAQIQQMHCEMEKLSAYEANYFQLQRRFELAVEKNQELETERDNIQNVNLDLMQEFQRVKQELDTAHLSLKYQELRNEEQKNQIKHLKDKVVRYYEDHADDIGKLGDKSQNNSFELEFSDHEEDEAALFQNHLAHSPKQTMLIGRHQKSFEGQNVPEFDISMSKEDQHTANESAAAAEEASILADLDTTAVFHMRDRVKNYIVNTVQLQRQGLNTKILALNNNKQKIFKAYQKLKIQRDELLGNLDTQRLMASEWQEKHKALQRDISNLNEQLAEEVEENQRLRDEKKRILGVNTILEQKIQCERSEKMTLMSEVDNMDRRMGGLNDTFQSGNQSVLSMRKRSKFSTYITRQQDISSHRRFNHSRLNSTINDQASMVSQQALWMKNQTRKQMDQYSQFKSQNRSFVDDVSMSRVFDDVNKSKMSFVAGSNKGSFVGGQSRKERVQVVTDFDSDDESIANINQNDLAQINQHIGELEELELIKKRQNNVYDLLGLQRGQHELNNLIDEIIAAEDKARDRKPSPSVQYSAPKSVYSEAVKLYVNKTLKEALLVVYNGIMYFVAADPAQALQVKPFHFLDEVSKIIYCEQFPNYLAVKLRDMKKHGYRDHVIFEVGNKDLLVDYLVEFAEGEEDDIIFEFNQEFSMLVNSAPVWFNFEDIERHKKEQAKLLKTGSDNFSGFLEIKSNSALNIIKGLLNKSLWNSRYCVIKNSKLFVYRGAKDKSPELVLTFKADMSVTEVRRGDIDGKNYVLRIVAHLGAEPLLVAASSETSFARWLKALKQLKEQLPGAQPAKTTQQQRLETDCSQVPREEEAKLPAKGKEALSQKKKLLATQKVETVLQGGIKKALPDQKLKKPLQGDKTSPKQIQIPVHKVSQAKGNYNSNQKITKAPPKVQNLFANRNNSTGLVPALRLTASKPSGPTGQPSSKLQGKATATAAAKPVISARKAKPSGKDQMETHRNKLPLTKKDKDRNTGAKTQRKQVPTDNDDQFSEYSMRR